jgi:hypothetical protein
MELGEFHQAAVRDLAWVLSSPGLLAPQFQRYQYPQQFLHGFPEIGDTLVIRDAWCRQQFAANLNWLRSLEHSPRNFLKWLQPRHDPRLGYYFESLVEYWLRHLYSRQRLFTHCQVKDGGRTVGEFDFLFDHPEGQITCHWEVAVKYYLRHKDNASGAITWYGPNPRDRLDLKLQRLLEHQVCLSLQPAANTVLEQLGRAQVVPNILLKGYLFYPAQEHWRSCDPETEGLSPQHLRGWWTYIEPFHVPQTVPDARWLYLPQLRWLAPALVSSGETAKLMNLRELHNFCLDLIDRRQKPPLIAELQATASGDWQEVSRGFVVPQHWPMK